MEAQSLQGITVSQSDDSNGMIFFCPFNKEVYTTSQYCLDESGHTAQDFNLHYDGGMFLSLYCSSSKTTTPAPPEEFPPGTEVSFVQGDGVCIWGSVIAVPTSDSSSKSHSASCDSYTIWFVNGSIKHVSHSIMATITCPQTDTPPLQSSQLVLPSWIGDSQKVTLEIDGKHSMGQLGLDKGNLNFTPHRSKQSIPLPNFALTYKSLLDQQLLLPGWHSSFIPATTAAHVSASGLIRPCPETLLKALAPIFADRSIWHNSYMEELTGLVKLSTYQTISLQEYHHIRDK
eukprot:11942119-Ditylum_brightwellii.AAC.1